MKGGTYDVDGESPTEHECEDCGDTFVQAAELKAGTETCPSCSGGVIGG